LGLATATLPEDSTPVYKMWAKTTRESARSPARAMVIMSHIGSPGPVASSAGSAVVAGSLATVLKLTLVCGAGAAVVVSVGAAVAPAIAEVVAGAVLVGSVGAAEDAGGAIEAVAAVVLAAAELSTAGNVTLAVVELGVVKACPKDAGLFTTLSSIMGPTVLRVHSLLTGRDIRTKSWRTVSRMVACLPLVASMILIMA